MENLVMEVKVIKRDGKIVGFDSIKILNAIKKAFDENKVKINYTILHNMVKGINQKINCLQLEKIDIEEIQNIVQKTIAEFGYEEVSNAYINYRAERTIARKSKQNCYKTVSDVMKSTDRENANVGNGPSAKLLQIGESLSRDYTECFLTPKGIKKYISEKLIYPHDNSWSTTGTTTCTFIPLGKKLQEGFDSGHGYTRPAKRIGVAMQHACIILQANQNDQHGGQAFAYFDRDLAPIVKLEYQFQLNKLITDDILKQTIKLKNNLDIKKININEKDLLDIEQLNDKEYKELSKKVSILIPLLEDSYKEILEKLAWKHTRIATYQAAEALIMNFNSMHSRAGAQVPFSSLNLGLDTSKEGRLVTEQILKAYESGLGNGEQAIFPNIIFQIKNGVSWIDDPNEDLLRLSVRVTSKRMFPNYVFEDCTLNKIFKNGTAVMGCRTALGKDIFNDELSVEGRGNLSFTSINLPKIALLTRQKKYCIEEENTFNKLSNKYNILLPNEYKDFAIVKNYFIFLNEIVDITILQLKDRLENIQGQFRKKDFPFLMSGIWMNSEELSNNDKVLEVIKHGSLGVGFIGLAETLIALVGKHHGESLSADQLGESIVKFLRTKCDEAIEKYHYNFGLIATPAEGLTGKFMKDLHETFGNNIKGVTDKEYLTNSFHVPVYYECGVFHKIKVEGKYHKYCNGGNISYVEVAESCIGNEEGLLSILTAMKEADMSYVAINIPIDRCKKCGFIGNIARGTKCPCCSEIENISRPARITGYLAEEDQFGYAKYEEKKDRVKHIRL